MERAVLDRLEHTLDKRVKGRFPDGVIQRVALLQHGEDPVVEPGEVLVRVFLSAAAGPQAREQSMTEWESGLNGWDEVWEELSKTLPDARRVEVTFDDPSGGKPERIMKKGPSLADIEAGGDLTPVMARLGPVDLDTLDTLITAGIAASRAAALRWVLARIRERPAYARLSERARELDELKAQF